VSASGLIYAAIALMWAAVLIPMWLRNHDTASENRSVERFGQAMRVLSRREQAAQDARRSQEPGDDAVPARTDDAVPARRPRPESQVDRPLRRPAPRATARPVARKRRRRPPRSLAQRRARTLGVLAALALMFAVAAPLTPVPWWAALLVVVLLVAFVVHLRVQALQKQRRRTSGTRPRSDARAGVKDKVRADRRKRTADRQEAAPAEDRPDASGFVSGPSRAVTVETKRHAASASAAPPEQGDEAWAPNPLPLPTYVTAPKAVRPIKVIDLTTPGAWTSGRLLDDGMGEEDLLAAEVQIDELDALLEHEASPAAERPDQTEGGSSRRAVGD
jgi:hypothetical protein